MKKLLVVASVLLGAFVFFTHHTKEVVSKDIVVDFADNVSSDSIERLENKLGIKFVAESDYTKVDKVFIAHYEGTDYESFMKTIRDDSSVEVADVDGIMSIPENEVAVRVSDEAVGSKNISNDPFVNKQWHLKQVHLSPNWKDGVNVGEGIVAAVLDTGGGSQAEDIKEASFVKGYNFIENNENTQDFHGHGQFVSGCIAQNTNNGIGVAGVAYKTTIMPVKVLSDQGSGSMAGIIQGIDFAVEHHANLVNMSLGGGPYNAAMAKAIERAHQKGVVIIAASGNSSQNKVSFPAAYKYVIAVGATDMNEDTTPYSNYGEGLALVAPGGMATKQNPDGGVLQNTIVNGKDGYYSWNGTSFSSPIVAAAVSMIMSEGVKDPDTIRKILTDTARKPKDNKQKDFTAHYGAGILDIAAAIKVAHSMTHPSIMPKLFYVFIVLVLLLAWLVFRKKR